MLTGALAAIAVSCSWYAAAARNFIDGLNAQAAAKVAGAPGIRVNSADGMLNRDILLSGPVSDFRTRDRLIADVAAIPGVAEVRWSFDAEMPAKSEHR